MADTFRQVYLHVVFSVKNRDVLINEKWRNDLYPYISKILINNNHKPLAVNGTFDHIHILFGLNIEQSVSDIIRIVKSNSSKWINKEKLANGNFRWQEGYGVFSCSHSHMTKVVNYINNQIELHRKKTFTEEYKEFLDKYEVEYNKKYMTDI